MSDINYELELRQEISNLYKVFELYHLNSHIAGCPCCVTEDDQKLIKSKILNQLTVEDLNNYAFHAISTWGTIEDFKHFLPRLLELTAFEPKFFWSSDTVIRKLSFAEFDDWTEAEQKVINQYLVALWNYVLSQPPRLKFSASDFIDSLLSVNDELNLFLVIWQKHPSLYSLLHLSEFISYRIDFNKVPIKIDYFSQKDTKEFLEWLSKDEIIKKLEQYFFDNLDEPWAEQLATTIDILNCVFNK